MREIEKLSLAEMSEILEAKQKANNALEISNSVMKSLDKLTGIYVDIADLKGQLKSLDDKLANGFEGVHARQDKTNGRIGKAEDRLLKLENWRWYLIGGGSVILFIINFGSKFIKIGG